MSFSPPRWKSQTLTPLSSFPLSSFNGKRPLKNNLGRVLSPPQSLPFLEKDALEYCRSSESHHGDNTLVLAALLLWALGHLISREFLSPGLEKTFCVFTEVITTAPLTPALKIF